MLSQTFCGLEHICLSNLFRSVSGLKGSFKFAIFASGYLSRCVAHQNMYYDQLGLPTLHVFGESDTVIPEGKDFSPH